ncbi:MAG: hypothetical protein FWC02_02285 [Firmicutes bacterium]|nr:hypothetical protein [Bacillota bacterium]
MMNSLDYLNSFQMFTKNPTLKTVGYFVEKLGRPHKKFKSIYVTGTNGKGSVCETLFAVLTHSGLKVGKFMSPFLIQMNEYIEIGMKGCEANEDMSVDFENKKRAKSHNPVENYPNSSLNLKAIFSKNQISGGEIEEYLIDLKPLIEEKQKEGVFVTFWEVITTLACLHFAKHEVDIAIIETGIESPVDCTNIIDSLVTLITKIDIDHESLLGNTVEENMKEVVKSLKPNSVAITANNLKKVCDIPYLTVESKDSKGYKTPLVGEFQKENLALCLKCFETLNQLGFNITEEHIHEGLAQTKHRARFETIMISPKVVFDGCHNANAVGAFLEEIKGLKESVSIIIALLVDKDISSFMKTFAKGVKKLKSNKVKIVFTAGTEVVVQGGSSGVFYSSSELMNEYAKHAKEEKHLQIAELPFEDALKNANKNETTYIIGSFKTYKKSLEILKTNTFSSSSKEVSQMVFS